MICEFIGNPSGGQIIQPFRRGSVGLFPALGDVLLRDFERHPYLDDLHAVSRSVEFADELPGTVF